MDLVRPTASAMLAAALSCVPVAAAWTQSAGDAAPLPTAAGRVAQYTLTPHGDVDGLILEDGTEIHLPPHLGPQLVRTVRPGDAVTVRGLRARAIPMMQAMAVTNDVTGASVADTGSPDPASAGRRGGISGEARLGEMLAQGTIRSQLHGPRGDFNGVLLTDGAVIRLPPPEAQRLSSRLQPGMSIAVQGPGSQGPLGRAIQAVRIGPDPGRLAPLAASPGTRTPPPPTPSTEGPRR